MCEASTRALGRGSTPTRWRRNSARCSRVDALRSSCTWRARWTLTFGESAYAEGAGLPSFVAPHMSGACWSELSVDGALANICGRVENALKEVVGCRLLTPQSADSFTSRRSKDDRPFIEAFFGRRIPRWDRPAWIASTLLAKWHQFHLRERLGRLEGCITTNS